MLKTAEERIKDKLAVAAREKLAQATKEKQLQAERKRKAAMFISMLKTAPPAPAPAPPAGTVKSEEIKDTAVAGKQFAKKVYVGLLHGSDGTAVKISYNLLPGLGYSCTWE